MKDNKTYIICEAGLNHNGKLETAKRFADWAKKVKANAVKYQCFWDLRPSLKKYELTQNEWLKLKKYCDKIKIEFLCTPHDTSALVFIESLVDKIKIASPHITNMDFMIKARRRRKPLIISTGSLDHKDGMAESYQIRQMLKWIGGRKHTLLHCVSKYPNKDDCLWRHEQLELEFGKRIGLSSHTKKLYYQQHFPVIEKHMKLKGRCIDFNVSLSPAQFKKMVDYIRKNEKKK